MRKIAVLKVIQNLCQNPDCCVRETEGIDEEKKKKKTLWYSEVEGKAKNMETKHCVSMVQKYTNVEKHQPDKKIKKNKMHF